MSMMRTLAKVAIGVAVAKGVGSMISRSRAGQGGSGGGTFGGQHSPERSGGGGLQDMMRDVLGGGSGGGLGGGLGGGGSSSGGGLGGLLGGAGSGGAGGALGGLGGLIEGLTGGASGSPGNTLPTGKGGFGDKLNDAFRRFDEPEVAPTPQEEDAAGLMLKAMIQAAKSDGKIDQAEQDKLMSNLGEISAEERAFVNQELAAPMDVEGLARAVPKGMESQVYVMSVMGIDLDSQAEAQYLHQLAQAMGMGQQDVNHIHQQLGVPALYT